MKFGNICKEYISSIKKALRNHWDKGENVDGQNRILRAVAMEMARRMLVIK